MSRTLFIVRAQPGADASRALAGEWGIAAEVLPLFVVKPVAWRVPVPRRHDALLVTSANAVRHAGPGLAEVADLPVHAVGEATAAAARAAGLHVETVGRGDAAALLALLQPGLRLLHLAGVHHHESGHAEVIPVYHSREVEAPGDVDRIAGQVVAVHSPRSARRLRAVIDAQGIDPATIDLAAISDRAAAAAGPGWRSVAVADTPDDGALLDQAARLCQTPAP
jgi:uroporphyrinogen-III synthase